MRTPQKVELVAGSAWYGIWILLTLTGLISRAFSETEAMPEANRYMFDSFVWGSLVLLPGTVLAWLDVVTEGGIFLILLNIYTAIATIVFVWLSLFFVFYGQQPFYVAALVSSPLCLIWTTLLCSSLWRARNG